MNSKQEAAGREEERGHPTHHCGWEVGFFLLFPITNVFFSGFVELSDRRTGRWWQGDNEGGPRHDDGDDDNRSMTIMQWGWCIREEDRYDTGMRMGECDGEDRNGDNRRMTMTQWGWRDGDDVIGRGQGWHRGEDGGTQWGGWQQQGGGWEQEVFYYY